MSDDEWLRRLAQVNREEQEAERSRLDESWDRLSAGELSPEEEAALRRLGESSEEAREAYEAFRPLGPEFQAGVVRALQERMAPPASAASPPAVPRPPAPVVPFRRLGRQGGVVAATAAIMAIAAALVLLLLLPGHRTPISDYGYAAELSGGVQALRGAPSTSRTFVPGSSFELVVRPRTAVAGPVEVRCFLRRGAELRPWPAPAEVTAEGLVRIAGTVGREIAIPPGESTLWVVVGRPGKLPDAALLSKEGPAGSRDWTSLKVPLKAD
jgi:hypothetical protein